MPVVKLLVEGKLDAILLERILRGQPLVSRQGSKNSLPPQTRAERKISPGTYYLRDRDFDFDPDDRLEAPLEHRYEEESVLGWRWCRHEIENYMIQPQIVEMATLVSAAEFGEVLVETADRLRHYEAARWAIGQARRSLPPNYELRTHPEGIGDLQLPVDLLRDWLGNHVGEFRDRAVAALEPNALASTKARYDRLLRQACDSVDDVLVWFSGTDLLAGLSDWLRERDLSLPGDFRTRLRDWIVDHPDETLDVLREWRGLVQLLRQ